MTDSFVLLRLGSAAVIGLTVLQPFGVRAAPDQVTYFERWERNKAELEAQGITRPMFLTSALWIEGKYLEGFCAEHLGNQDALTWKMDPSPVGTPGAAAKNSVLLAGLEQYRQGLADGLSKKPSDELCSRTISNFRNEQSAILRDLEAAKQQEAARAAGGLNPGEVPPG